VQMKELLLTYRFLHLEMLFMLSPIQRYLPSYVVIYQLYLYLCIYSFIIYLSLSICICLGDGANAENLFEPYMERILTLLQITHVPYRDSKLTRLLQDSLGGIIIYSLLTLASIH